MTKRRDTFKWRFYCDTCEEPFVGDVDVYSVTTECPRCRTRYHGLLKPGGRGEMLRENWRRLGWRWRGWQYARRTEAAT